MTNDIKADTNKLLGIKIRLYPDEEQKRLIKEISDLYRFAFNYALMEYIYNYLGVSKEEFDELRKTMSFSKIIATHSKSGNKTITYFDMCKKFGKFRKENKWLQIIPRNTANQAIKNLYTGYRRFYNKVTKRPPKLKSKKSQHGKQSFSMRSNYLRFTKDGKYVKIEGIKNPIYCGNTEGIPKGKDKYYYSTTISYDGYEYWLSFKTEIYNPIQFFPQEGPIGIDVGMRKLATLSDGTIYKMPNTKKLEKRIRRARSKVDKDTNKRLKECYQAKTKLEDIPKSNRMQKRYNNYRRLNKKYWNIKRTFVHTMTRQIVNRHPSCIVMEDLNVAHMIDKHYRNLSDNIGGQIYTYLFGEIKKQIAYKAKRENIPVIYADRYFPSSQICSKCGHRRKPGRSEVFKCPECGLVIDRDYNAALNLKSLAINFEIAI